MSKSTKIPGIPKPPADVSPGLRGWLSSVAEALEIRLGRRGDPKDRAVTLRELIDSGLAEDLKSTRFDPNNLNTSNIGFAPNTVIDSTVPPQPTNFSAAAAYSQVNLSWDYPNYSNHSFTEIYGHDSDVIGDAQLIGVSTGRVYIDPIGSGESRYYWIRHVSTSSVLGPWNSGTGTLATTAADVDHLLTTLSGAITSSELHSDLTTPISAVAGIQTDITDIESNIDTLEGDVSDIENEITDIDTKISNLKNTPAWASGTAYVLGDLVSYSSNLYSALTAHTSSSTNAPDTTPQDSTEWKHIGAYESIVDVLVQTETTKATLQSDYITTANSNSAIAAAKTELRSAVYEDALGLSEWDSSTTYTYSTDTNVRVFYEDKVYVLLRDSSGDQPDDSPDDWQEDTVQSESSIKQNHYTKTDTDSAISAATSSLVSTSDLSTALGNYTTTANLETNYYTETEADSAISAAITDLVSTTDLSTALGDYTTTADLETDYYTETDTDSAISTAITTATSGFDDPNGGSSTVTLQQAMTTQATLNGTLKGQYTVKIDANGHVAGFGLANTATASGTNTSEFYVNADRFAILPNQASSQAPAWGSSTAYASGAVVSYSGGFYICKINHTSSQQNAPTALYGSTYWSNAAISPFAVQSSGTTHSDGTYIPAGVYMNTAHIKYADITAAQIGSVNADKITAGEIDVANRIGTDTIEASKLLLDGTSLKEVTLSDGRKALGVDAISANAIESGTLDASDVTIDNLYANSITGDINLLSPFTLASAVGIGYGGDTQIFAGTFDAVPTDSNGVLLDKPKKPYVTAVGFGNWENGIVYQVKLQMKANVSSVTTTVGSITSVGVDSATWGSLFWIKVSGNKQSVLPSSGTLKIGSNSYGTVSWTTYEAVADTTKVYYIPQNGGFTSSHVNSTLSITTAPAWQTVSEIMFRAAHDYHPEPFAISGGLSTAYSVSVDFKITITTLQAVQYQLPSTGVAYNTSNDKVFALDGLKMSLR